MKKYIYLACGLFTLLTACDKKLNILPEQSVAEEVALGTDANVKKVLNGLYDAVSDGYLYGGDLQLYSELLAADGEIRWEGTYNEPDEIWSKNMLKTNGFVTSTWLSGYKAINVANNVLGALDVVDDADRDRVHGEAQLLRGMLYFELLKLYAQPYVAGNAGTNPGLPLVLNPTRSIDSSSYVSRSSVEATYQQILSDMTSAESLLPATNGFSVNSIVAAAMLSRVYLQMGDFAAARDAANRAITKAEAAGYELTGSYEEAFNNTSNSSEDIFAIQVSAQDGDNDMHLFWSIPDYGGRDGDVSIQQKHLNLYEATDERLDLFYDGAGAVRSGKWKFQYRNLPVIRLAELYLTRAETNLRLGTTVGATPGADLSLVRERVGLLPNLAPTLDQILKERKLELAHEGQAVADLKRLMKTADGFAYNATEMVFPIPQREIDASRGVLEQNQGY